MPRLLATLALARSLSFMRLVYEGDDDDDDNIFARKWPRPPSFLPPVLFHFSQDGSLAPSPYSYTCAVHRSCGPGEAENLCRLSNVTAQCA